MKKSEPGKGSDRGSDASSDHASMGGDSAVSSHAADSVDGHAYDMLVASMQDFAQSRADANEIIRAEKFQSEITGELATRYIDSFISVKPYSTADSKLAMPGAPLEGVYVHTYAVKDSSDVDALLRLVHPSEVRAYVMRVGVNNPIYFAIQSSERKVAEEVHKKIFLALYKREPLTEAVDKLRLSLHRKAALSNSTKLSIEKVPHSLTLRAEPTVEKERDWLEPLPAGRIYTPDEYADEYTEQVENARIYARLRPEKTDIPKRLIFFGSMARRAGERSRFFDELVSSLPGEDFVHTRGIRSDRNVLSSPDQIDSYIVAVGLNRDEIRIRVHCGADQRHIVKEMHEKIFIRLKPDLEGHQAVTPRGVLSEIIEEYTGRIETLDQIKPAIEFLK